VGAAAPGLVAARSRHDRGEAARRERVGLGEDDWLHLARVWHRAERVLLEATGAERAIILKLGILTPHLHVHIYPMGGTATRDEVFAAIDGRQAEARDEEFVRAVRAMLARIVA
jgi:hypothetical protein